MLLLHMNCVHVEFGNGREKEKLKVCSVECCWWVPFFSIRDRQPKRKVEKETIPLCCYYYDGQVECGKK